MGLNDGKCVLIHKGGDSLMPSQYRPITVPSNILRLLTVRMNERMTEVAERNSLIGPHQFGFRGGRSTIDAVMVLSTLLRVAKIKR